MAELLVIGSALTGVALITAAIRHTQIARLQRKIAALSK
jgi:hypothetical protein